MKYIILFTLMIVTVSCAVKTTTIKFKSKNFENYVDVYTPSDSKNINTSVAFIILHGKRNGRQHSGNAYVASSLSNAGYSVYAPEMPYNNYQATLTSSFEHIDQLVKLAAQGNKKIILIGHSMGSAVAFLYCAAYSCAPDVIGIILQAPGHMLQLSQKIQEASALDVQRARKLLKQGTGNSMETFADFNQGQKYYIDTTPEIYLSYFDPGIFPNPATHLDTMKVPVLWIDGKLDKLPGNMGYENLFNRMNNYTKFPQNKYIEVDGGHVDMMNYTPEVILKWAKQFDK